MADINTTIAERLTSLAEREQIVILYACESGNRAWEFPSPDSDYIVISNPPVCLARSRSDIRPLHDRSDSPIEINALSRFGKFWHNR